MENKRDKFGFIELEKLEYDTLECLNSYTGAFSFNYDNRKYFFKKCETISQIYNELIAEEIAIQFGIPCAHYDLASKDGFIGTISENILEENDRYIGIEQILKQIYKKDNVFEYNNLKDIWIALCLIYNKETVLTLMNELVNIFIYDILIGNIDRHIGSYGIVENEYGIHFSKVFDNERMLSYGSINYGIYSLGIDRNDYHPTINGYHCNEDNFIKKFVDYCESSNRIEEKLKIISEDNIEQILQTVEKRINAPIQSVIRKKIKSEFIVNLNMIKKSIQSKAPKAKKYS